MENASINKKYDCRIRTSSSKFSKTQGMIFSAPYELFIANLIKLKMKLIDPSMNYYAIVQVWY